MAFVAPSGRLTEADSTQPWDRPRFHVRGGVSPAGPRIVLALANRSVDELASESPAVARMVQLSASSAGEGRSVSDIRSLPPTSEAHYARVAAYITEHRATWEHDLSSGPR
jgi:hypothetical protein